MQKFKRITWRWGVELLFGAIIPTWTWGLFLAFLMITFIGVGKEQVLTLLQPTPQIFQPTPRIFSWTELGGYLFSLLVIAGGLLGLISLWLLILCREDQIKEHQGLRWFVIVSVLLGEGAALYAMAVFGSAPPIDYLRWGFLIVTLGGPIVIGLRYLRLLLRSTLS